MALLYYGRPDNYRRDLDFGAGRGKSVSRKGAKAQRKCGV